MAVSASRRVKLKFFSFCSVSLYPITNQKSFFLCLQLFSNNDLKIALNKLSKEYKTITYITTTILKEQKPLNRLRVNIITIVK